MHANYIVKLIIFTLKYGKAVSSNENTLYFKILD